MMNRNEMLRETEELKTYIDEIGDFYAWIRDYWTDMARSEDGAESGMLNFGFWPDGVTTMHDAQHSLRRLVLDAIQPFAPEALGLEVGCGIGGAAVGTLLDYPVRLSCLDLVPAQIERARSLADQRGVADRAEFCVGSSMDMPFENCQFDFAYCLESSFHYPDKTKFFSELSRVLKPGAMTVIADITCEDNASVTFRRGNHFSGIEEMKQLMTVAGFQIEQVIRIGNQVFVPLHQFVEAYSQGRRGKLYRYWNLVLRNYRVLATQGLMGYDIFIGRKPGP
jgi:ubiquinone/menaquinone biosynthesis C-methylase UbiE